MNGTHVKLIASCWMALALGVCTAQEDSRSDYRVLPTRQSAPLNRPTPATPPGPRANPTITPPSSTPVVAPTVSPARTAGMGMTPATSSLVSAPAFPPPVRQDQQTTLPPNLAPEMLGDQGPLPGGGGPAPLPSVPVATGGSAVPAARNPAVVPRARGFKISENESPWPQSRVYFSFNYFHDFLGVANRSRGTGIDGFRLYREHFGLERAFLDGDLSVGMRIPLTTTQMDRVTGPGSVSTVAGDLALIGKVALYRDPQNGDVFSIGLAVVTPTGSNRLASAEPLDAPHTTILQPFLGYVWTSGNLFVHGFTGLDIPTDSRDVTILFNDVGLGLYLYRTSSGNRLLTGVIPTTELHLTTPLIHRGTPTPTNPSGLPDIVNLTFGVTLEFLETRRLALGVGVPMTGPRPFEYELLAQLRFRF